MLVSAILGASMSNPAFTIPLPKSWPAKVRSAMLHVVSLAKYAAVYTRSWADRHEMPRAHLGRGETGASRVCRLVDNGNDSPDNRVKVPAAEYSSTADVSPSPPRLVMTNLGTSLRPAFWILALLAIWPPSCACGPCSGSNAAVPPKG
jgi:hypothetical protein